VSRLIGGRTTNLTNGDSCLDPNVEERLPLASAVMRRTGLLMSRKIAAGAFNRCHGAEQVTSMSAVWLFSFDIVRHLLINQGRLMAFVLLFTFCKTIRPVTTRVFAKGDDRK
jgi:hypothetical protein